MTPLQRLEAEILQLHDRLSLRPTLETAIRLGERLQEAKSLLPYGEWVNWVRRVGMSARTAQVYMQVSRHAEDTQNSAVLSGRLSIEGFLST